MSSPQPDTRYKFVSRMSAVEKQEALTGARWFSGGVYVSFAELANDHLQRVRAFVRSHGLTNFYAEEEATKRGLPSLPERRPQPPASALTEFCGRFLCRGCMSTWVGVPFCPRRDQGCMGLFEALEEDNERNR